MKKFYIILRSDMASLNTIGRAAAQSSHITDAFSHDLGQLRRIYDVSTNPSALTEALLADAAEWRHQTKQGFGTVMVLDGGTDEDISLLHKNIASDSRYFSNIVIDPEYLIMDGTACHHVPNVVVGMYVFPRTDDVSALAHLNLR